MAPKLNPGETTATQLMAQIAAEIARLQQEAKTLRDEAAQRQAQAAAKDEQVVAIRVQLATLAGDKEETVKVIPAIGELVEGEGIYLGTWHPKDRTGRDLGKTFAVYADTQDLKDTSGKNLLLTFNAAAKEVAAIRGHHGHDGIYVENDTALYKALEGGSAAGKWFMPTRDLLVGTDIDDNKVQTDNLCAHKDKGAFKGTFTISDPKNRDYEYPNYYWSCSEHRDVNRDVYFARVAFGSGDWDDKDDNRLSCRPVRVEALSIHATASKLE